MKPKLSPTLALLSLATSLAAASAAQVKISQATYHGWPIAYRLTDKKVEVVVVPEIGRVMQFKFVDETTGPFFENEALSGKSPNPDTAEWANFGGDKSWPSPQSDWPKITKRGWPPPKAFDSMPVEARVEKDRLILTSSIDPSYGIQTRRTVSLVRSANKMRIVTEYEKVQGDPIKTGVWVITQLKSPERVFLPLPGLSLFSQFYSRQSELVPEGLEVEPKMVSCTRSSTFSSKIGSDGDKLIWGNEKWIVMIDSPLIQKREYPDGGSSAEIYTNPDPLKYVELEMLGPLSILKVGDRISQTNSYTIFKRDKYPLRQQVESLLKRSRGNK